MSDENKKQHPPAYVVVPYGHRFQVIETSSSLILRTVDTKTKAQAFAAAVAHNPNKKERT